MLALHFLNPNLLNMREKETLIAFSQLFWGILIHLELEHILNVAVMRNKVYISNLGFQENFCGRNVIRKHHH